MNAVKSKRAMASQPSKRAILSLEIEKFFVCDLWQYMFVLANVVLVGWLTEKLLIACMFCVAHIVIRNAFDKQYHCDSTVNCLTLSVGIIWLSLPVILPLRISLLASVFWAFLVCLIGFLVANNQKPKPRTIQECNEQEIETICKALGYNKEKTELVKMLFVERKSNKQVWQEMCLTQRNIEWDTVTKYKYRISQDFKKYLNK